MNRKGLVLKMSGTNNQTNQHKNINTAKKIGHAFLPVQLWKNFAIAAPKIWDPMSQRILVQHLVSNGASFPLQEGLISASLQTDRTNHANPPGQHSTAQCCQTHDTIAVY